MRAKRATRMFSPSFATLSVIRSATFLSVSRYGCSSSTTDSSHLFSLPSTMSPIRSAGRPSAAASSEKARRFSSSTSAGTSSRLTYSGPRPATCIASSRASCWKSSVRATKSVSQFSSSSTPRRPP